MATTKKELYNILNTVLKDLEKSVKKIEDTRDNFKLMSDANPYRKALKPALVDAPKKIRNAIEYYRKTIIKGIDKGGLET